MKKLFILLAIIMIALCVGFFNQDIQIASAMEINGDEFDAIFIENIEKLAYENYQNDIRVSATKEPLYDIELVQFGFVYDFTVNDEKGYAILINSNGMYEIAEVFFDADNPYRDIAQDEYRVYANNMLYLRYANGKHYMVQSNKCLDEITLNRIRDNAYYASSEITITTASESISFVSKQENKKDLAVKYPALSEVANYPNACGPIAGGGIIQYWDRFCTELIPNYTPYAKIGNSYLYKEISDTLNSVVVQLYQDMGTNTIKPGTSVNQFINGMNTFCSRQGYTISYSSCMSNNKFDYIKTKEYLESGMPIVLFLDTFNIATISSSDGVDDISYINGTGCHAMTGYGYKEISYVLNGNINRTDRYIAVGSGLSVCKRGYFNINYNTQIDDAFSISIS